MMGEQMDLNFQLFETATLFISVIVVAFFLQVSLIYNLEAIKYMEPTLISLSHEFVKMSMCVCCYVGRDI